MLKNLKVTGNLIILGLALNANAFSQTISNGDFESNSSSPSCAAGGHAISLATPWLGIRIDPYDFQCNSNSYSSSPSVDYFDNSVTSACQFGSGPHGGNGYAMGHEYDNFGFYDVIYQGISGTVNSGFNYYVECFVRANSASPSLPLLDFSAFLVNQSVGSSAAAIGADIDAQAKAIGQGNMSPNLTSVGSGWYLFKQTLTVPSTGSYYLVLGDFFYCNDFLNPTLDWQWQIDDVSFKKQCAKYHGTYTQDAIGCCPITGYNWASVEPIFVSSCATVSWVDCSDPSQATSTTDQQDFQGGTFGMQNPSIDITQNGTYTPPGCKDYCISASGACCETVNQTIQVCLGIPDNCCKISSPVTSINKNNNTKSDKIGVYPNPVSKVLSLDLPDVAESIKIYNSEGKRVFEISNIKESNLAIDVSQFKKGVYFLSAIFNSGIQNVKIVVE